MFRHRGKNRSFTQNLKLATFLSFVAGVVNIAGFFSICTLTTNVTGHFAFFADELVKNGWGAAQVYLWYILAFLGGAFISSFAVEGMLRYRERYMYVIPLFLEMAILMAVSFSSDDTMAHHATWVAGTLLFAMGMQNALVTSVSNAIVRTTHLTGLFTDLGIEIGQLFFYKEADQKKKLTSSIQLRMAIIAFFFAGCIVGGYGYFMFGISILRLAVICLVAALVYDGLRYKVTTIKRKYMK